MGKSKKYHTGVIKEIVDHSKRVKEFRVQLPEGIDFLPGQYLKLNAEIEGSTKSEEYTVINLPNDQNYIHFAVDNHPKSTIGKELHTLGIGDNVTFRGPKGNFQYDPSNNQIVSIVRDIGIVSALGNLEYLTKNNYSGEINFYNYLSDNFDEVFSDRINSYSDQLNINYYRIHQADVGKKLIKKGKFTTKDLEPFIECGNANFYLSGKSKFMKKLRKNLINMGIEKDQIKKEYF